MNFEHILFEKENDIARITLNVPKNKNPLTSKMRAELLESFSLVRDDISVKVVVMTGAGNAFCSGGDIRKMGGKHITPVPTRQDLINAKRLIQAMVELEKPIIAAVNGPAVGAGMNLALACDILIASENARLGQAFTNIGAIPDYGGHYFLPLRVGVSRAKELMFTGDIIDAQEADRLGLVNRVVPHEKLEEEVLRLANRLANGPGQAYALIKAALNRWPAALETVLEMEANMQAVAFSTQDFIEGRKAFLEKRKPVFFGK
jgi:2-(1,2-epoxy-1,2-dihydrophenyl)acetyl-CoA isomerase